MITRWMIFVKERFALPVYLALCMGISISSLLLTPIKEQFLTIAFSSAGLLLFFFTLRIMDECKDYKKDLIAHPNRPLPRGLIGLLEAQNVIFALMVAMMGFACLMFLIYGLTSFILYLFITFYLFLMFREFYLGEYLSHYPLLYALTHQIILFPLIFFSLSLFDSALVFSKPKILFASAVFFAFFTYEIGRKLDPNAPQILGTYWQISGRLKTSSALIILCIAGMISSFNLFNRWFFLPATFLVLCAFIVFMLRPRLFKWVEMTASISLLVHIWSVGLWRLFS